MKITSVIFDVDGVLLDTVPYHFMSWKRLFEEEGIPFNFNDYLLKVNGVPRIAGITNIIPHADNTQIVMLGSRKQKYFTDLISNHPPQPLTGVLPLLKKLIRLEFILCAASSSKNAPLLLSQTKLLPYFSYLISGHDFTKPKPNPEIFLTVCQKANIDPHQCVVVEDALSGIKAAQNASMFTIGVLTSNDKDIRKEADLTVDSLREHTQIINFINNENIYH